MNDLVKRLNEGTVQHPRRWSGDTHSDLGGSVDEDATDALMKEAARALEAMKADADRRVEEEREAWKRWVTPIADRIAQSLGDDFGTWSAPFNTSIRAAVYGAWKELSAIRARSNDSQPAPSPVGGEDEVEELAFVIWKAQCKHCHAPEPEHIPVGMLGDHCRVFARAVLTHLSAQRKGSLDA